MRAEDIKPDTIIIHPEEGDRLLVRHVRRVEDDLDAEVFDGELGDPVLWVRRLEGEKEGSDFQLCVPRDKWIEVV